MPKSKKAEKIGEILMRDHFDAKEDKYVPVDKKENLSKQQWFNNINDAIDILYQARDNYEKISPVSRFFSYFVPNSWTEAGRLRNEVNECEQAFKDKGYVEKDMQEFYSLKLGKDIYDAHIKTKASNHFFTKDQYKELHKYAQNTMIDEPIDLTKEYGNIEDSKTPFTVDDASYEEVLDNEEETPSININEPFLEDEEPTPGQQV